MYENVLRLVFVPSPSWPHTLLPTPHSDPSPAIARLLSSPAATSVQEPASNCRGLSTTAVFDAMEVASLFRPHATIPSGAMSSFRIVTVAVARLSTHAQLMTDK